MKHLSTLCLLTVLSFFTHAQQLKTSSVHFEVDQHRLTSETVKKLDKLISELKYYRIQSIALEAHTDHDASDSYNVALSKRRADAVALYLTANGIRSKQINSSWFGERRPLASNQTDLGKQKNRRVDISIQYQPYSKVEEVLADLKEEVQEFPMNPSGGTTIRGDEGIEIQIPENAWMTAAGKAVADRNVQVELEEFTTAGESFVNQLSTQSGDETLETGGMLRIDGYSNGEKLMLRKGVDIVIQIPREERMEGMTVFTGQRRSDGVMDWDNTGTSFDQSEILTQGEPLDLDTIPFLKYVDHDLRFLPVGMKQVALEYPQAPLRPKVPGKPHFPRRPDPSLVYSGLRFVFSTENGRDREADRIFEERKAKYQVRMERYEQSMRSHSDRLEIYKEQRGLYVKEVNAISDKIDKHIAYLTAEFNELKSIYDQKRLNYAIYELARLQRNGQFKTAQPEQFLKDKATIRLEDELYQELKSVAYFLNLYTYLSQFDPEYIQEHFIYKDKLRIHRMKKRGMSWYFTSNLMGTINQNVKYDAMMSGEEVPSILNAAVAKKMRLDQAKGITTLSVFDQAYTAVTSRVGWINCDRFSRRQKNRMVQVSLVSAVGARMMVYIKRMRSLLNANIGGARVPRGTKIKAIFMTTIDGKPHLSITELQAEDATSVQPHYKPVTLEEIEEIMAKL